MRSFLRRFDPVAAGRYASAYDPMHQYGGSRAKALPGRVSGLGA
jgi:hypothetical protein